MWVIKDVVKRLVGVISFFVSLWKDKAKGSMLFRWLFVHPSFILRYFFDSGAENKPWQGDGIMADQRC